MNIEDFEKSKELKEKFKRIVKLINKVCIVESEEDAIKEGYKNLSEYNFLTDLNKVIKNFIKCTKEVYEKHGKVLTTRDEDDLKQIIIQAKLTNGKIE